MQCPTHGCPFMRHTHAYRTLRHSKSFHRHLGTTIPKINGLEAPRARHSQSASYLYPSLLPRPSLLKPGIKANLYPYLYVCACAKIGRHAQRLRALLLVVHGTWSSVLMINACSTLKRVDKMYPSCNTQYNAFHA